MKDIQQIINECVEKCITEERKKNLIRKVVAEELSRALNEGDDNEESGSIKRNAVMKTLKDPKFNHAQLAYDLYHPKDQSEKDTVRSLFSKKATGKPDNDGAVRKFSDEEINQLYQMVRKH